MALVSTIKPKAIDEALSDEAWIKAMKEELQQFNKNNVWTLVQRHEGCSIIETRYLGINQMKMETL